MKTNVLVENLNLPESEWDLLNKNEHNVIFNPLDTNNFLPPEMIMVIVDIAQNIGYNAAYDLLKFIISKIIYMVKIIIKGNKECNNQNTIRIISDGKEYTMSFNFDLTDSQKDKLIDAAIKKLLKND